MPASDRNRASFIFLGTTFLLVLIGLAVLANSSIPLSQSNFGTSFYYLTHQLIYGLAIGLVAFFAAGQIKPVWIKKLSVWGLIISLILLVLVLVPGIGFASGGAKRWLHFLGMSFQPSELAKLALIVFLAHWLESKKDKLKNIGSILPFMFWALLTSGLIIMEPDYGTFAIILAIAFSMFFVAGAKVKTMLIAGLIGTVIIVSLGLTQPYRRERILSFINPQRDTQGQSYQQHQALIAIGSGGAFGLGLGKGVQKYNYLPETMGDSAFAIISEELGFLGASLILFLFLVWILSGLKLAASAPSGSFAKNAIVGVVAWIGLQSFLNILGILGLIPFAGVPLPFISYGSSALVLELAAVGLVVNLTKRGN